MEIWLVEWRWIVFGDMAGGVPVISARCVAIYFLAANLQIHFLTNHQPTSSCHLLPSCYEGFSDSKCLKIARSRNFPHKKYYDDDDDGNGDNDEYGGTGAL